MLEEDELKDAILLVFANKQDQNGALGAKNVRRFTSSHEFVCVQVSDILGLAEVRNRQWSIQETCAVKAKGLFEGLDWLVTCMCKGGS